MRRNKTKLSNLILSGVAAAGIIFACDAQIVSADVQLEGTFSKDLTEDYQEVGKKTGKVTYSVDGSGNKIPGTEVYERSDTEFEYTTNLTTDELRQLDLDTLDRQVLGAKLADTKAEEKPSYKINTAKDKGYMNPSEKDVVLYSNYARMYPKNYAKNYLTDEFEKHYIKDKLRDEQRLDSQATKPKDPTAVSEARKVLNAMEPQEALYTFKEYKDANKPYIDYVANARKLDEKARKLDEKNPSYTYIPHERPQADDPALEGVTGTVIEETANKDIDGSNLTQNSENLAYGVYSSKSEKDNSRTDGFYAVLNWIIDYGETKSLKPSAQMDRGHRRVLLGENNEDGQPIKLNRIAVNQIKDAGKVASWSTDQASELQEQDIESLRKTEDGQTLYPNKRETITSAQYGYSKLDPSTTDEAPATNQDPQPASGDQTGGAAGQKPGSGESTPQTGGDQAGGAAGQKPGSGESTPQTGGDQAGGAASQEPGSGESTPQTGGDQTGGAAGQEPGSGESTPQTGGDQTGGAAGQKPGSGESTPQTGGDQTGGTTGQQPSTSGQSGSQTSGSDSKVQPGTTTSTQTPETKPALTQKQEADQSLTTSADKGVKGDDKLVISSTEEPTSQVKTYQAVGDSFNKGNEVDSATAKFLDEKPENVVTMEVTPKVDNDTNREFDITFKDSNGNVVSVNGRVLVTLPTGGRTVDYVYHMVDGVAEKIDHVQDVKEYVEFVADDFRVYGMKFVNASQTQTSETKAQTKPTNQAKTTNKDNKASSDQLPETGEAGLLAVFNQSALSILAGLGLIAPRRKKD